MRSDQEILKGLGLSNFAVAKLLSREESVTILTASATLDFTNISGNNYEDITVPVVGAMPGDVVAIGIPPESAGPDIIYIGRVISADLVNIRANNPTNGAVDTEEGIFKIKVFK